MTCDLCPKKAVWRWEPGIVTPFYLCDDHAASKDLNELTDLTGAGEL
jgi:hypothetical protein